MTKILVLHGPNLNRLGCREPGHYGVQTLAEIDEDLQTFAETCGHSLESYQSHAEHALIERIHQAADEGVGYILFNPAAFTHTSIALRDALLAVGVPFVEIHLSRVAAREAFRRQSFFSDIALGVISGFGANSYLLALQAIINRIDDNDHGYSQNKETD